MSVTADCTVACENQPHCAKCLHRKAPYGRDVPAAAAGGYCNVDCPAYYNDPKPGHLWPGELERTRDEAGA